MEFIPKKYKRKSQKPVVAIRLDLDTPGLVYQKNGEENSMRIRKTLIHVDPNSQDLLSDAQTVVFLAQAFRKIKTIFPERPGRVELFVYPDSEESEYHVVIDPGTMSVADSDSRLDQLCEWWEPRAAKLKHEIYPVIGVFSH